MKVAMYFGIEDESHRVRAGLEKCDTVMLNRPIVILFLACYAVMPVSQWPAVVAMFLSIIIIARMPSDWEFLFIGLIILTSIFYYLVGSAYIMPYPLEMLDGTKRAISSCFFLIPLFLVRRKVAIMALEAICYGVIVMCICVVTYTFIHAPEVLIGRNVIMPGTDDRVNSPMFANTVPLVAGMLILLLRPTTGWIALGVSFVIAILLANRTGVVLSIIILAFALYSFYQKKTCRLLPRHRKHQYIVKNSVKPILFVILLIIVGFIFIGNEIIHLAIQNIYTRFAEEGLESQRFASQSDGIIAMLSGESLLGGRQVLIGDSVWYHNIFLDAYRVAGVPGFMLILTTIVLSFSTVCKGKNPALLILWLLNLFVLISSVILESILVEYVTTFSILCAPFLLYGKPEAPDNA